MTSGQAKFPIAPSIFKFNKFGNSGMELSELIPSISSVADELCLIRTMHTEAINHDPAITFCQTGSQLAGKPSIGSWVSYGLGSENKELPAYVVLTSFGSGRPDDQPLYDRLWSAGFLPSKHQGVKFRNKGDAVLYLSNPSGMDVLMLLATLRYKPASVNMKWHSGCRLVCRSCWIFQGSQGMSLIFMDNLFQDREVMLPIVF
jgi:hypothetical protein